MPNALKNVLLIDDDPINNLICRKKLHKAHQHLSIVEFTLARKGLEYLQQAQIEINLLLLDINMPDLNAWQFLDGLVKASISVPVVIITSSIDQEDMERANNYKMIVGYVIKPVTDDKIAIMISHIS